MTDEFDVRLGAMVRLVVEPEPDPRYGPEDLMKRDWLEFEVYRKMQSVTVRQIPPVSEAALVKAIVGIPDQMDLTVQEILAQLRKIASGESAAPEGSVANMLIDMQACSVVATALRQREEGDAVYGFRWRLVWRAKVDDDALTVEIASSRARLRRWHVT
jgi:hypothetical protein